MERIQLALQDLCGAWRGHHPLQLLPGPKGKNEKAQALEAQAFVSVETTLDRVPLGLCDRHDLTRWVRQVGSQQGYIAVNHVQWQNSTKETIPTAKIWRRHEHESTGKGKYMRGPSSFRNPKTGTQPWCHFIQSYHGCSWQPRIPR